MSYEEEKQDRKIERLEAEIERLRAENAGLSKAVIDTQEERDLAQAEFRAYHKAWEEQATRIQELEDALVEKQIALMLRTYRKAWEAQAARVQELRAELASANVELMAAGETVRAKEARIQELEDALVEYRKLGKTIAGKVPCLTLHGDCGRCSTQAREVCGALEQLAASKIGANEVLSEATIHKKMEELPSAPGAYRPAIREEAIRQLRAEGKIGAEDATPKIKRCYSCGRPLDEIDCDNFTCCDCAPSWQITEEREEAFGRILRRLEYDQSLPGRTNYKIQRAMELLRAMLREAGQ